MPAELPFSPEDDMDTEFVKWMNEFALRSEGFDEWDVMDLRHIADQFLEKDERKEKFIDDTSGFIEGLKSSGPKMDRLPVLHVTRENLTEVERESEMPADFLDGLTAVVADYINGFIPEQDIAPPEISRFDDDDLDNSRKGSYRFSTDRSKICGKGGRVKNGSPAATVSAHETMHKNNVEAIIPNPQMVRNYALTYSNEAPQSFENIVESTDTAPVNHNLLGGLGLLFIDEFYEADVSTALNDSADSRTDIKMYSEEFKLAVDLAQDVYNLETFDVRDETICQAVSFFMNGILEEGFDSKVDSKKEYYNSNDDYSDGAGDDIFNHLNDIKSEYEKAEGLRGQRFKEVMGKRIPFLKGEERFQ